MTHAPLNAQAENYLVLCEEVVRAKAMDWEIPTIWLDHSDQEMWVLCSYWWGQKRILPQGEGGLRAKIEQGLKDKKRLVIGSWGHYAHDWSFPLATVLRPLTMEEAVHQDFHWEKALANRRERKYVS